MNKYIQIIISLALATMALIMPNVALADGGCVGQYGQAVVCPTPLPKEEVPVKAGFADVFNPLTVGAAFTGVSAVMYYKARKSTLAR